MAELLIQENSILNPFSSEGGASAVLEANEIIAKASASSAATIAIENAVQSSKAAVETSANNDIIGARTTTPLQTVSTVPNIAAVAQQRVTLTPVGTIGKVANPSVQSANMTGVVPPGEMANRILVKSLQGQVSQLSEQITAFLKQINELKKHGEEATTKAVADLTLKNNQLSSQLLKALEEKAGLKITYDKKIQELLSRIDSLTTDLATAIAERDASEGMILSTPSDAFINSRQDGEGGPIVVRSQDEIARETAEREREVVERKITTIITEIDSTFEGMHSTINESTDSVNELASQHLREVLTENKSAPTSLAETKEAETSNIILSESVPEVATVNVTSTKAVSMSVDTVVTESLPEDLTTITTNDTVQGQETIQTPQVAVENVSGSLAQEAITLSKPVLTPLEESSAVVDLKEIQKSTTLQTELSREKPSNEDKLAEGEAFAPRDIDGLVVAAGSPNNEALVTLPFGIGFNPRRDFSILPENIRTAFSANNITYRQYA